MSRFASLEEQRVYEKQRREKYKATHKAWRDKHKEELKLNSISWREENTEKYKEYGAKYYKTHPERRAKARIRNRGRASTRKSVIHEWKKQGCQICGFKGHPAAFDAHHIDASLKLFTLGRYANSKHTEEELKAELRKCACLCAVCHRLVHIGVKTLESRDLSIEPEYSI